MITGFKIKTIIIKVSKLTFRIKAAFALTLIFASAVLFIGCQKTDRPVAPTTSGEIKIPDWVKHKALEAPKSFTKEFNLKSKAVFLDKNEQERSVPFWGTAGSRLTTIPCDQTDENFVDNNFILSTITLNYNPCNSSNGFTISVKYFLSTAFTPVLANPASPTQTTRGRVRIRRRSDNVIVYTNSNVAMTSSDIAYYGPDGSNPNKQLYTITYTTPTITGINVNDVYFDNRPIVYSDCEEVIITPYAWDATPWSVADVCTRVDPVQISANGSGSIVYLSGCDSRTQFGQPSCYSSSFPAPNEHEVWYNTGSGWFTIMFNDPYHCTPAKLENLPSNLTMPFTLPGNFKGNVQFRYRNVKKNSTNGCSATVSCTGGNLWQYVTVNVQ